ncbi:Uma2 family endonuclease [Accumulibacter sp.]|uniref:Uma2 family endonuclease n=1 Tax=Accumulibacter sp. TaxID=2053492 RepID=UPI0025FB60B7|nr:Uma2 family endonuclease [Accumulibacter sp.]MCM8610533.1 Uma2 family endonuclease [Accumulibacter sp.]MCM8634433.1 Uma2 family endonuclease [Accumulibacter sp.]MCM8641731.1 Uma2 family endonuclease [Accumulibacter sp.]
MRLPQEKPSVYEDLFALPEYVVGEIIDGRLVTHPRPAPRHARASSSLGFELGGPFDLARNGPGGWWILDEPEIHLEQHVLVPDVAGWRRERLPRLPETAGFDLAPDWVCEILSPATARVDRAEKLPIYAAHGVQHAWLVDPDLRILDVLENRGGQWLLLAVLEDEAAVAQPPFAVISFALAGLWAD